MFPIFTLSVHIATCCQPMESYFLSSPTQFTKLSSSPICFPRTSIVKPEFYQIISVPAMLKKNLTRQNSQGARKHQRAAFTQLSEAFDRFTRAAVIRVKALPTAVNIWILYAPCSINAWRGGASRFIFFLPRSRVELVYRQIFAVNYVGAAWKWFRDAFAESASVGFYLCMYVLAWNIQSE